MRILIEGAKGQLGRSLCDLLETFHSPLGTVSEIYRDADIDAVDFDELDLTNNTDLVEWFDSHEPYDLIINCAAMTNVDGCDQNEPQAFALNALGVSYLARQAEAQGAKLVQVSTDYVFAGDEREPRVESDPCRPISAYGRTKLAGEWAASAHCSRTFIVRTAWLYSIYGKNFLKTMRGLGSSYPTVMVVSDQWGNPTNAADVAYEILAIAATEDYGLWHCTNEGTCSWADFAAAIMKESRYSCLVEPCSSAQWKALHPESASRPDYSSLENAHLKATIGNSMRPWQEALREAVASLKSIEV